MALDIAKILARPDVMAEYQQESTRDAKSRANLVAIGANTPEAFAEWWANNFGVANEFQLPQAPAPVAADPTPAPTTNAPTTEQDTLSQSINSLLGLYNQQQASAQQKEVAREAARGQVQTGLGTASSKLNSSILGNTVNDVLTGAYGKAKTQLDRGKARGMYNDVGYNAGLGSLETGKAAALTKLNTTANDLLSGYRKSYDDIRSEALDAANNWSGTGAFDLTDYSTRANEILANAQASAPGALQSAIGGMPLFDLNAIRSEAGQAQGAVNLQNTDVIEALAKRKQAQGVGRGLGSQGSF